MGDRHINTNNFDRPKKSDYIALLTDTLGVWLLMGATILVIVKAFGVSWDLYSPAAIMYYTGFDVLMWFVIINALEVSSNDYELVMKAKATYRMFQHITFICLIVLLFSLGWYKSIGFLLGWYIGGYDILYCLCIPRTRMPKWSDININWMGWSAMGIFGNPITGKVFYLVGAFGLSVSIFTMFI